MSFLLNAGADDFPTRVQNIFQNFGPQDIVDIILLAALLLLTVTLFSGKKAFGMLICIACSLLILFITDILGLETLNSVFSSLLKMGTVIIVVIFQPEIRDFLDKISNSSKGFHAEKKPKDELHNVISHVCKAVGDMSAEGIGALIVMERVQVFNDFVHPGVEINADVSSQLLENIFVDKTPLHDGAVIITDCKIRRACCLLPLPKRSVLDVDLGSRHSAALGLSEVSDGIAIVVSEETGAISVAVDGSLKRFFTSETLRRFLIDKLIGKDVDSEDGE